MNSARRITRIASFVMELCTEEAHVRQHLNMSTFAIKPSKNSGLQKRYYFTAILRAYMSLTHHDGYSSVLFGRP